jgi:hypothetical protein
VNRLILTLGVVVLTCLHVTTRAQPVPGAGFAAVPGKGGQDPFGPYEPVADWPQDFSELPGYENWTWGSGQGIFAESSNRIFVLQRGLLKRIERPENRLVDDQGTRLRFPVGRQHDWRDGTLPWRDATVASPAQNTPEGMKAWKDAGYRLGVDAIWQDCIVVVDGQGRIVETWDQWDSMLARAHSVHVSPYDPEKHVWIVDDYAHAIYKFTNDGKRLVQTLGTPHESGSDSRHFGRPTFMAFLPDAIFVADGYVNSRVVKFDNDGNYLLEWGQKGVAPNDTRPGYFNCLHGIDVDRESRRAFVSDRENHRTQVCDENGKFLDQWHFGDPPSDIQYLIVADGAVWAADAGTTKILKYDLDGHFLYSWGSWGTFPGGMWGVHGMTVDEQGNFYIAEVNAGVAQKLRPRPGANPAFLIGPPPVR